MAHLIDRRLFLGGSLALIPALPGMAAAQPKLQIGLILVAASWCPVCKVAAPVIEKLAAHNELPILVVSKDNRPIPPFTDFVQSSGHPIADQIVAVPALLFFAPAEAQIVARLDGFKDTRTYIRKFKTTLISLVEAGYARVG